MSNEPMTICAMCGEQKYPYSHTPRVFDKTQREVHIWWDTSVWICAECWSTYRVDALLAPVRFMIESNRWYREAPAQEDVMERLHRPHESEDKQA